MFASLMLMASVAQGNGGHVATIAVAAKPAAGGIAISWAWRHKPHQIHFRRYPKDAEGQPTAPVYLKTLPLTASGTYLDRDVADGTRYVYELGASWDMDHDLVKVEAETPVRRLPPLKQPELRVDKAAYVLTVVDGGKVAKRYPVALGRSPKTRKTCFDNASTPEGVYRIAGLQPRATYHRAYDLSYPNAADRARWRAAKALDPAFPPIGGEIQIHGRGIHANWTYGCIALRDADIDELFGAPAIAAGTTVRIWGGELKATDVGAL